MALLCSLLQWIATWGSQTRLCAGPLSVPLHLEYVVQRFTEQILPHANHSFQNTCTRATIVNVGRVVPQLGNVPLCQVGFPCTKGHTHVRQLTSLCVCYRVWCQGSHLHPACHRHEPVNLNGCGLRCRFCERKINAPFRNSVVYLCRLCLFLDIAAASKFINLYKLKELAISGFGQTMYILQLEV